MKVAPLTLVLAPYLLLSLSTSVAQSPAPQAPKSAPAYAVLPQSTLVHLKLAQTISSADEKVGNLVAFTVIDDVKTPSRIVIPHDSEAIGHVTQAEPKKWGGRGGKLDVMIDYVRLPDGSKIALTSNAGGGVHGQGGGHTGAMTGAMVGTAIVFFPAAPFLLMIHGKDIVLSQGAPADTFTATDTPLPPL